MTADDNSRASGQDCDESHDNDDVTTEVEQTDLAATLTVTEATPAEVRALTDGDLAARLDAVHADAAKAVEAVGETLRDGETVSNRDLMRLWDAASALTRLATDGVVHRTGPLPAEATEPVVEVEVPEVEVAGDADRDDDGDDGRGDADRDDAGDGRTEGAA